MAMGVSDGVQLCDWGIRSNRSRAQWSGSENGRSQRCIDGAEDAVAPAAFVDGEGIWRELLALATDQGLHFGVRKAALFWVGQQAADAVTDGVRAIAEGDPQAESVPILMELAKTSDFGDVRRSALFWLAQSDDVRVPGFLAEILGK